MRSGSAGKMHGTRLANGSGMTKIIAGSFKDSEHATEAVNALRMAGFPESSVTVFHNNAPGQHDQHPAGGDEGADPAAKGAGKGAATTAIAGSLVGAGIGAAVGGPLGAVAGAGVGAYTGAFAGTMRSLPDAEPGEDPQRRPAAIMVAVDASGRTGPEEAVSLMRKHAAFAVEEAEGEWSDGQWVDFDPLAVPRLVWRENQPGA